MNPVEPEPKSPIELMSLCLLWIVTLTILGASPMFLASYYKSGWRPVLYAVEVSFDLPQRWLGDHAYPVESMIRRSHVCIICP